MLRHAGMIRSFTCEYGFARVSEESCAVGSGTPSTRRRAKHESMGYDERQLRGEAAGENHNVAEWCSATVSSAWSAHGAGDPGPGSLMSAAGTAFQYQQP